MEVMPLLRGLLGHSCAVSTVALFWFGAVNTLGHGTEQRSAEEIVEMLVSDRAEDVVQGESDFERQRSVLIPTLLREIGTSDPTVSGNAAVELGLLISPWLRGKQASARFLEFTKFEAPRRPVGRLPDEPESEAIRSCLQMSVLALLSQASQNPKHGVIDALNVTCETLGEVADDRTMDWVLDRLSRISTPAVAEPLVALADSYLGVPPIYRSGAICGLMSAEERERVRVSEESALKEACRRLNEAWAVVKPLRRQERIKFAIERWREHFVPKQESSSGHYSRERWLFLEMEPLVRFGIPAVELLREQQARETVLEVKAVWEAIVATITGQEDAELVRALFVGRDAHRELACEIVLGAVSKAWLPELDELQYRSGFNTGKASRVIAACHREEGLPALKKAFEQNRHNFNAGYAVRELEERAVRGAPKGMLRHQIR